MHLVDGYVNFLIITLHSVTRINDDSNVCILRVVMVLRVHQARAEIREDQEDQGTQDLQDFLARMEDKVQQET